MLTGLPPDLQRPGSIEGNSFRLDVGIDTAELQIAVATAAITALLTHAVVPQPDMVEHASMIIVPGDGDRARLPINVCDGCALARHLIRWLAGCFACSLRSTTGWVNGFGAQTVAPVAGVHGAEYMDYPHEQSTQCEVDFHRVVRIVCRLSAALHLTVIDQHSDQKDIERGWRVGHRGRDSMYYEELINGVWARLNLDGEMLLGEAHHVIYFADEERWAAIYPAWAQGRRAEIIERIKSEFTEPDYLYDGG